MSKLNRGVAVVHADMANDRTGWYSRKWGTTPGGFAFDNLEAAESFAASLQ